MLHIFILLPLLLAATAAGLLVLFWLQERRRPAVLCLMYHRLATREDYGARLGTERVFTMPVEEFDAQIAHLKRTGYAFVTPDQVQAFASGEAKLPDRSILITFDDGCRSFATLAVPVLKRHGACAIIFVAVDAQSRVFNTEGDPRMTDQELAGLEPAVAHVGSHTVTHRPLRGMPEHEVRCELTQSKSELERLTGRPVRYLAFPGNWFDGKTVRIAREAGYEAIWCSWVGAVRSGCDCFALRRINIEGQITLRDFSRLLTPFGVAQRRFVSLVKTAPGRLLGPGVWLPIRKLLLKLLPGGYISFARWRALCLAAALCVVMLAVAWFWLVQ